MGNWGEASLLFLTSRVNVYRVNIFTENICRVNIFIANVYQVQANTYVYTYWVNIFRVGSTFIASAFRIFCTAHVLVFQSLQSYGFLGFGHWVGHGVGHMVSYKYSLIYFMRTLQDCSQNITTLVQLISMRNSMKIWLARFCFLEVNTVQ